MKENILYYKISRMISDLRNGFCVSLVENASKTFFFCKNTIYPEILSQIKEYKIVTTSEFFNYQTKQNLKQNVILNQDYTFHQYTNQACEIALQICKNAELEPILIMAKQDFIPFIPREEINCNAINFEIKNFQYEISMLTNSEIQLHNAPNSEIYAFGSKFGGHEHYAILINNPLKEKTPLVRIHSSCYTGDLLASLRCDCRDQLQESISFMNQSSGILLYIMQEGRGIGLANKIKAYNFQQKQNLDTVESNLALGFKEDERSFLPVAKILEYFNKKSIRLITNNPKKINDLVPLGITVTESIPTYLKPNEYNKDYLKIKQEKMGHNFHI